MAMESGLSTTVPTLSYSEYLALNNNNSTISPVSSAADWSTWSSSEMVEMLYQMCFFLVGAPLNALALRNFSKSSRKSNQSSEFRLIRLSRQLLVAHLMVLCIYCLWRTFWIFTIHWTLGNALCKLYSFLSALPFHLWSNMVAAIAIDMLYCIVVPLSSVKNGGKRVTWLIRIAWAFAILCASPMAIFRGTVQIPGTNLEQCYHLNELYSERQLMIFHFFHVVTTFYIPLFVILFSYAFIGISLRHQIAQRHCLAKGTNSQQKGTTMRFLKATAAIVCTFVLTWLPYQVMALLRVICEADSQCERIASNFNWLQSILIASTCINPFLYRFGIFRTRDNCPRRAATCLGLIGGGGGSGCESMAAGGMSFIRKLSNASTQIAAVNSSFRSAPTPIADQQRRGSPPKGKRGPVARAISLREEEGVRTSLVSANGLRNGKDQTYRSPPAAKATKVSTKNYQRVPSSSPTMNSLNGTTGERDYHQQRCSS